MIDLVNQPFNCIHCNKRFMQERTLFSHMCEPKRRVLQRDEKRVVAGMVAFNRFYQLTQASKKQKTYEDFCKSPYYNAFVKFGSFVTNISPLYPDRFVDYVIKSGTKLDHWCRDELYEKYLYDMIKIEPVESAIQRSITTMLAWADVSQAQYNHYFKYVNHNRAVNDIRNGYISPWLVLNCNSGKAMVQQFSDEQLDLIAPAFDIPYWVKKFKENKDDVDMIRDICKGADIE